jgi:YfiH family protein
MVKPSPDFLTLPQLERIPWLVHGFGTGAWEEADLDREERLEGFTPVIMRQLHSGTLHRLEAAPPVRLEGDALMTDVPGLLLVVRTADCLPVLLVDGANRAVAAVHCGWRGTQGRILDKAVAAMEAAYGTDPRALVAAVGPCIGPCCYAVGPEVRAAFHDAGFPDDVFYERGGRAFLDLRTANVKLLDSLGVGRDNIVSAGACTRCAPGLLSHRRDKDEKRRMFNFIGIRRAGAKSPGSTLPQ